MCSSCRGLKRASGLLVFVTALWVLEMEPVSVGKLPAAPESSAETFLVPDSTPAPGREGVGSQPSS